LLLKLRLIDTLLLFKLLAPVNVLLSGDFLDVGLPLSSVLLHTCCLLLLQTRILIFHFDLHLLIEHLNDLVLHIFGDCLVEGIACFIITICFLQSFQTCIEATLDETLELFCILLQFLS